MAIRKTDPEHIAQARALWGYSEAGNLALAQLQRKHEQLGMLIGSIELTIKRLGEEQDTPITFEWANRVRLIVAQLDSRTAARERCLQLLPSVSLVLHELTFWRGFYTGQHEAYRTVLRDVEHLLAVDHAVNDR